MKSTRNQTTYSSNVHTVGFDLCPSRLFTAYSDGIGDRFGVVSDVMALTPASKSQYPYGTRPNCDSEDDIIM